MVLICAESSLYADCITNVVQSSGQDLRRVYKESSTEGDALECRYRSLFHTLRSLPSLSAVGEVAMTEEFGVLAIGVEASDIVVLEDVDRLATFCWEGAWRALLVRIPSAEGAKARGRNAAPS